MQLSNQTYNNSCLTCHILEIDQIYKRNCQKSLTCIKLFFDHNLIFEEFFKKYHDIIEDLYINDINHVQDSTLFINIKHYNLTEIDAGYLNSIFNITSPPYNMLKIEFNQNKQNLKPLRIVDNFSLITNSNIIISIPCFPSNHMIDYRIQFGKIEPTKSLTCELPQYNNLTTMIILHTSTNLTTSIPSQSSSFLLYLFLIFFIITICVIITSTWSFLRKNHSHDTGDEHLNNGRNIINTDRYGVTEKDSKSAASWSHRSGLLLSPLVK